MTNDQIKEMAERAWDKYYSNFIANREDLPTLDRESFVKGYCDALKRVLGVGNE